MSETNGSYKLLTKRTSTYRIDAHHDLSSNKEHFRQILIDPANWEYAAVPYTYIEYLRKYLSEWDHDTHFIYYHYLKGTPDDTIVQLLGVPEFQIAKRLEEFFSKAYEHYVNTVSHGISIRQTEYYINSLQDSRISDEEMASKFNERLSTVKIMRLFMQRADITHPVI